ncbi:DUF6265 family protein [Flavobacterium macrobrachii]|uniref:DUF6265 domain-containing protein n=1 Tax=Flavobacterium macrobrachii TaxID=591204 RepID=A0ABS2CUH8_9FLAO|nr:DUF6265 family protein [Flavobacterium macrobrachii]MBM6498551.1 hypothetical protein [Flavobacterium macrobrachii]
MKNVVILAVVVVFISCQNKSEKNFDELEKMSWLVGEWENKMPDGILTETWTKANDSTFTGKTLFIRDKDTLHSEEIVLTQKGETLLYIPTVKGQNDNKPVEFKITESKIENEFAFENPKHDYPQKIVYKKVNETNLVATISGKQQGKSSSESYPMKKK